MAEMKEAKAPEKRESYDAGPQEIHIVKKYGKFHGHLKMGDGAEHKAAPGESIHEVHASMGHLLEQHGGNIEPAVEVVGPKVKEEPPGTPDRYGKGAFSAGKD